MTARLLGCALVAWLAAGCAAWHAPQPLDAVPVELEATPFHPQRTDQCGPAALTAVLQASGAAVAFDDVARRVYLPARGGSLQLELLAAARAHDRLPVRVPPEPGAITQQLAAGRPVLVMQNLGWGPLPVWHYAVVVGFLTEPERFVLRSGPERRHVMPRARFERTWARAERWAITLFAPDDAVSGVGAEAYLSEAAALESLGRFDAARRAYRQALERWPDHSLARLGAANSAYGLGDLHAALAGYRRLLAHDPANLAARNNLAQTLADLGCTESALAVLDAAPIGAEHPLAALLLDTRSEIVRRAGELTACAADS